MPNSPQEHQSFLQWLEGQWFVLIALITGSFHAATAQSKINRHEEQLKDLKEVPTQIARLETKIDMLLEEKHK